MYTRQTKFKTNAKLTALGLSEEEQFALHDAILNTAIELTDSCEDADQLFSSYEKMFDCKLTF